MFFAGPVAFLFGVALVVVLLAAGHADFDLDPVVFPVHRGGHQRVALAFDCTDQLVDFLAMQQQLACAPVVGDDVGRGGNQRRDRSAEQINLAVLDRCVAIAEIDSSGTQAFDFPALQGDTGLVALIDVILVARALVQRDGRIGVLGFILGLGHCVWNSRENAVVPLGRHGVAYVSFRERLVIQIRRSAIVRYTAAQMFALVNDIDAYPRRFAWCVNASVLTRTADELTARLELRVAGMTQSFTTRNLLEAPQRIVMQLIEGPFRSLAGEWNFTALGETGCKVALALDFDYSGRLMAPVMRAGFEKLADRLVDEFCREAERTYA